LQRSAALPLRDHEPAGLRGTDERRTPDDTAIAEAEIVEAVIRRATGPVHLVGHSFGGLVALAVALRDRVPLQSVTIAEAPAANLLRDFGEHQHYRAFRDMTDAYFASFRGGNAGAIGAMIDFYGGAGTFAAWPARCVQWATPSTCSIGPAFGSRPPTTRTHSICPSW
jgi:pimeloyl-ACP methyl ester carboxylesterase